MGKYNLRRGKNASEIKSKWMFDYPNTVVERVQKIGKTTDGKENYYHIFYHERQKESKRSKTIRRIRSQGGKHGVQSTK